MTRKQLRERVINEIGLQDIEDYDESVLVDDLIYQGTIDLLARTRCTVRCVHLQVTKDESTYVLDKSILALVDLDDGHIPRYRRDEHGHPSGYIGVVVYPPGYTDQRRMSFNLIRSDLLRLDPAPSEDGEVDVWAVLRPQRMDEDADSPSQETYGAIPDEYHDAIFLYACWMAGNYSDDESSGQGEHYRVLYEGQDGRGGKISEIKMLVNKRGTARAPRRRVRVRTVGAHSGWVG
jgi:hypothetical protein